MTRGLDAFRRGEQRWTRNPPQIVGRSQDRDLTERHGNSFVNVLRVIYGAKFAANAAGMDRLSTVLGDLDETAHTRLMSDFASGTLTRRIATEAERREVYDKPVRAVGATNRWSKKPAPTPVS